MPMRVKKQSLQYCL